MSEIRRKTVDGLKAGDTFAVVRKFTKKETESFGNITKDYNPVHYDRQFIEVKKLNGLICHGLLVASMITEIGGQIGWLASGMDFRFKKPVYFEDTITCIFKITEINEKGKAKGEAVYRNQNGTVVLEATLKGLLPGLKEKEVLKALI
ncbi:MAG: MaoC family dehydratase [Proteobacteria bacterium]|nr:MaoC family dehydratase [Pseudomonadota bacterium]MBU1713763.1 MaoC family dehydratase [Pseudomonadota bacterium]